MVAFYPKQQKHNILITMPDIGTCTNSMDDLHSWDNGRSSHWLCSSYCSSFSSVFPCGRESRRLFSFWAHLCMTSFYRQLAIKGYIDWWAINCITSGFPRHRGHTRKSYYAMSFPYVPTRKFFVGTAISCFPWIKLLTDTKCSLVQ